MLLDILKSYSIELQYFYGKDYFFLFGICLIDLVLKMHQMKERKFYLCMPENEYRIVVFPIKNLCRNQELLIN